MDTSLEQLADESPADAAPKTRGPRLPRELRLLYVSAVGQSADWLTNALAADRATTVDVVHALGASDAMQRLNGDLFDAVLVHHEPHGLAALEFLDAAYATCDQQPIVVLGTESSDDMTALCYEAGAHEYLRIDTATTRQLIWTLARAVAHGALFRKQQQLIAADAQRIAQENAEARRVLEQQAGVFGSEQSSPLPQELVDHYRELLRTYVVMGSGHLGGEIAALAQMLVGGRVSALQIMQIHVAAVACVVDGLGSRSAKHVVSRADLMALELISQLADAYATTNQPPQPPAQSRFLPGLDPSAAVDFLE